MDTGVQFAKANIHPRIVINQKQVFNASEDASVVVVDTATRHMSAQEAYKTIYDITSQAKEHGFDLIYKKTDSALRGNIGSELTALLDASGKKMLPFFPSHPKLNRCTIQGIHYIGSTPVSESVFGFDPFEPVKQSYVPYIIALQSNVPIKLVDETEGFPRMPDTPTIIVFDSSSTMRLKEKALQMKHLLPEIQIMAGCAGFAEFLPQLLGFQDRVSASIAVSQASLVVSGSLNPITMRQLDRAVRAGFYPINLEREDVLNDLGNQARCIATAQRIAEMCRCASPIIIRIANSESPPDLLDPLRESAFEANGQQIASNIGSLLAALVNMDVDRNLIITGGDILRSFMNQIACKEIIPLSEVESGVVFSVLVTDRRNIVIVSKSGGFGSEDVFLKIETFLREKSRPAEAETAYLQTTDWTLMQ